MISLAASLPTPATAARGTVPPGAGAGAAVAFVLPELTAVATAGVIALPVGRQVDAGVGEVLPVGITADVRADGGAMMPDRHPGAAPAALPVDPRFSRVPAAVDVSPVTAEPTSPVAVRAAVVSAPQKAALTDLAPAEPDVAATISTVPVPTPDRILSTAPALRAPVKAARHERSEKPVERYDDGSTEPDVTPEPAMPVVTVSDAIDTPPPLPVAEQMVEPDHASTERRRTVAGLQATSKPAIDASATVPLALPVGQPASDRLDATKAPVPFPAPATPEAAAPAVVIHAGDVGPAAKVGGVADVGARVTPETVASVPRQPTTSIDPRPLPASSVAAARRTSANSRAAPPVATMSPAATSLNVNSRSFDIPAAGLPREAIAPAGLKTGYVGQQIIPTSVAILPATSTPITVVSEPVTRSHVRPAATETSVPWRFAASASVTASAALAVATSPSIAAIIPNPVATSMASEAVAPVATPSSAPEAKPAGAAQPPSPQAIPAITIPAPQVVTPATVAAAGTIFAPAIAAADDQDRRSARVPTAAPTDIAAIGAPAAAPMAVDAGSQAPLDMSQPRWPQAMVDRIETLRDAADAADTRIRLVPDALGAIEIGLTREGDTIHVRFVAEQAQTRALLQEAQPRLAEAADQRGLKLGQTSIEAGAPAAQQQSTQQQGQQSSGGSAAAQSQASAQSQSQGQGRQPQPATPARPVGTGSTTTAEQADDDVRIA